MADTVKLQIWRGTTASGGFERYEVKLDPGMVVLDAVLRIQAEQSPDLAVRWNCKAGKCGSCGAEVNGKPKLMCMTRVDSLPPGEILVEPMKAFPLEKDLVCDVSWNYEVAAKIPPFKPVPPGPDGTWRMDQRDVDRVQEFRKCIECWLCQDVCHVIRNHDQKPRFAGPAFFVKLAALEMNPIDAQDRREFVKNEAGVGFCNITKCCTEVCPENIRITDNSIIPLKERVADEYYDPILRLIGRIRREKQRRREIASVR